MAVSKNQRSGPRQEQRPHLCPVGHTCTRVMVVPGGKGRKRFEWACPCTPTIFVVMRDVTGKQ